VLGGCRSRRITHFQVRPCALAHKICSGSIEMLLAIVLVGAACPLWVLSGHLRRKRSCPLYPRKQTFCQPD
jgi:hypothetical protein